MIGLIVIVGLAVYLCLSIAFTVWCTAYFYNRGKGKWVGFLLSVFLNLAFVFLDLIPVRGSHLFYCHNYSGVWVTVPTERWRAAIDAALVTDSRPNNTRKKHAVVDGKLRTWISDRIYWEGSSKDEFYGFLRRFEDRIVDATDGATLVKRVDYMSNYTGIFGGLNSTFKPWLLTGYCPGNLAREFDSYRKAISIGDR